MASILELTLESIVGLHLTFWCPKINQQLANSVIHLNKW